MQSFIEVALNKQYLDEDYFLTSLKNLSINKKDKLDEEGNLGLYYDSDKRIDILTDENNVIYHEITHFIDFSFNPNTYNTIFKCNDKYIPSYEYNKLTYDKTKDCEISISLDPNFIVEGGAEYFSSYYLNNNALRTYNIQTHIIGALAYIFDYNTINDIYFDGEKGYYNLFLLFINHGIKESEYNKFLNESKKENNE